MEQREEIVSRNEETGETVLKVTTVYDDGTTSEELVNIHFPAPKTKTAVLTKTMMDKDGHLYSERKEIQIPVFDDEEH